MSNFIQKAVFFLSIGSFLVFLVIFAYWTVRRKEQRIKLKWDIDEMFKSS